jgi:NAD+ kinase
VVVRRSPIPVRLARLHHAPFTDRLVGKFNLPVSGWRGPRQ